MKTCKTIFVTILPFIAIFTACKKDKTTPPQLITGEIISSAAYSVTITGTIAAEGAGAITNRGVVYSDASANAAPESLAKISASPVTGTGEFTVTLGLEGNKTYDVWTYATNAGGTSYGEKKTFVLDYDGNLYHTIKIGNQVWMLENLKTTRYKNGEMIPNITSSDGFSGWSVLVIGAYCNYENNPDNGNIYGRLYNGYAVDDSRGLAPAGWHIPSHDEWIELENTLGGENVAGGKMKEAGTTHWTAPNTGADNSSGFTALPGGYRNDVGGFSGLWNHTWFWTTSINGSQTPRVVILHFNDIIANNALGDNHMGISVRCIKD